ncbi:MAG: chromosome partitioning protein, partial [Oscillospiraceae bacterium]|nr:chromosome partitioning protein [Oscillospiraceae bacterium]
MGRLSLVIADGDEAYADSLIGFVSARYPGRFSASSFSRAEFLESFFNDREKRVDILLMDKKICEALAPEAKAAASKAAKAVILLCGGACSEDAADYPAVNKYQRGDRLISDIIGIFSEKTGIGAEEAVTGRKKTRIVTVFSPAGGTGKTCIAASLCIRCAQIGMTVFYLNFEDMQSTPLFFECSSRYSLSNFLYCLKCKDENLALKIESMRCIEPDYGIHFFCP